MADSALLLWSCPHRVEIPAILQVIRQTARDAISWQQIHLLRITPESVPLQRRRKSKLVRRWKNPESQRKIPVNLSLQVLLRSSRSLMKSRQTMQILLLLRQLVLPLSRVDVRVPWLELPQLLPAQLPVRVLVSLLPVRALERQQDPERTRLPVPAQLHLHPAR